MQPTPFNPATDLATTPFDSRHCDLAAQLKTAGLPWNPHVGCFVWDRDKHIEVSSPFPHRIYFILNLLNLGHFLRRFESVEEIGRQLIWLPTWHQARLLCKQYGVSTEDSVKIWTDGKQDNNPGDELIGIYNLLLEALK